MSFSVDSAKNFVTENYPLVAGIFFGLLTLIFMLTVATASPILEILAVILVGGFVYIFLGDFEQRKMIERLEMQKEDAIEKNIQNQREKDLQKTNCLSCNSPIKDSKSACPTCGFLLETIKA